MKSHDPKAYASSWLYETVLAASGNYVTRLRSSLFYYAALLSFIAGVVLLTHKVLIGAFLALTLAPFLLLYPMVRFAIGGRDSIGGVLLTAIVEEIIKNKVLGALDDQSKKKNRRRRRRY